MTEFGYTMLCEQSPPKQLVADLVRAERAGFDYAVISDHYFPWLEEQGHSPYAWSVLGAAAQATERIPLMTHVTCPIMRYHPAVVAQKAATMGALSDGRFTLGLGAGENLNEHVVGRGWPSADVRHEMFAEAVEIIRRLLTDDYVTWRGRHFAVDSAKLYDKPDQPVPLALAASGPESLSIAREHGDGLIAVEPRADLVRGFSAATPKYGMVPLSYDTDREAGRERAHRLWRWGVAGWKVMAELPGPVNFDAYSRFVRPDDVAEVVPSGPDLDPYLEAVAAYVDAGFTHVTLCQIGADHQESFIDWAETVLLPALRERLGEPTARTVKYQPFVEAVARTAGVDTRVARASAEATLVALARALDEPDRARLLGSLPPQLPGDDLPVTGGPREWDETTFVREVSLLGRRPPEQARVRAQAVLTTLADQDPELVSALRLPDELRALFTAPPPGGGITGPEGHEAPLTSDELASALAKLPEWTGSLYALERTIALPPDNLDRVLDHINSLREEVGRGPEIDRTAPDTARLVVRTASVGAVTALDVQLAARVDDAITAAGAGIR